MAECQECPEALSTTYLPKSYYTAMSTGPPRREHENEFSPKWEMGTNMYFRA
jgi:hypothetical protein